jgi:hypothetical protein
MEYFNKKSKKSPKPPQRHIILGIPANIGVGPLGFRAELDIGSKGEQSRCYHDLEADKPDPTAVPDEKDARASRIVFRDEGGGGQELPAPEASTSGVTVDGIEHGNDPAGECFRSLLFGTTLMWVSMPLPTRRGHR